MRNRKPGEDTRHPMISAAEAPIFASRWLQAPLYFGLIVAQCVYVYKFGLELYHLVHGAAELSEAAVMLLVLGLVDVVMVANLLLMVIVGGYETFVSRLYLEDHPDRPEWLDHVDAGVLKVKLAAAMVTISSVHLLKTFINADNIANDKIWMQIALHAAFLISVLTMAGVEMMMAQKKVAAHG